jgi:hypothetical protein
MRYLRFPNSSSAELGQYLLPRGGYAPVRVLFAPIGPPYCPAHNDYWTAHLKSISKSSNYSQTALNRLLPRVLLQTHNPVQHESVPVMTPSRALSPRPETPDLRLLV